MQTEAYATGVRVAPFVADRLPAGDAFYINALTMSATTEFECSNSTLEMEK